MANSKILGTYSPEDINIVISNEFFSHVITGYSDGTFIDITRPIAHATLYTGSDATHARVVRRVKNFDVTITLNQTSQSNDFLSQLLERDEEFRDNTWLFNLMIKDAAGRTVLYAPQAFIGSLPDMTFGPEISDRGWLIHAIGVDAHIGGNGRFTGDEYSSIQDIGYTPDERWNPLA